MTELQTTATGVSPLERLAERRARRTDASRARVAELSRRIDDRVRLRLLRKSLGLTQAAAGRIAGVTQADISRIENGEVNPTAERMNRIFERLETHAEARRVTALASPLDEPLAPSAVTAAGYLCLVRDEEDSFTHMKLQKLLYYAQGFALARFNAPLFRDPIYAWEHGPVVKSVWTAYRDNGAATLPRPHGLESSAIDDRARAVLEQAYVEMGQFEAWALRQMTHAERPWSETAANEQIPVGLMREYFTGRLTPRHG